ncbi:hypothetical protein I79_002216 [Cricetulus griseus]|uniref:Uncharacterized protein n=1 Tax=Cricetulus griseus TaxID=10029 RepID=G3GWT6_CRIGR|nr:hypothetical protein I79_002216 [Cricetulus griseus]
MTRLPWLLLPLPDSTTMSLGTISKNLRCFLYLPSYPSLLLSGADPQPGSRSLPQYLDTFWTRLPP